MSKDVLSVGIAFETKCIPGSPLLKHDKYEYIYEGDHNLTEEEREAILIGKDFIGIEIPVALDHKSVIRIITTLSLDIIDFTTVKYWVCLYSSATDHPLTNLTWKNFIEKLHSNNAEDYSLAWSTTFPSILLEYFE